MQVTDVSPNKSFCVLFLWLFFFFLKGNSGHWASWSQEVGKGVGQVAFEKEGVAL